MCNPGSINLDHVYRVPHLPRPGETLSAVDYAVGLGGKGANQSVAVAKAGAVIRHIGCVGREGTWALGRLRDYGVDVSRVTIGKQPTGHAIINVDPGGENAIVIFPGANHGIDAVAMDEALADGVTGDTLMIQNETSLQVEAARIAQQKRMFVVYSAAPFNAEAVRVILPHVSLLVVNEGEAAQLQAALNGRPEVDMVITRGSKGAEWISVGAEPVFQPAFRVTPVDTTGAGDTFIGTLVAGIDLGLARVEVMRRAASAAELQVTGPGAAQAIPTAQEVNAFLDAQ